MSWRWISPTAPARRSVTALRLFAAGSKANVFNQTLPSISLRKGSEPIAFRRIDEDTLIAGAFEMTTNPTVRKDTGKPADVSHPGMMGDGTEEQNLGERGKPQARIKKGEVDAAFGKQRPAK
jgi:hypothetical protein